MAIGSSGGYLQALFGCLLPRVYAGWLVSAFARPVVSLAVLRSGSPVLACQYSFTAPIFLALVLFPAFAFATSEFELQCQKLLPAADAFYDKCQKEGVPFGRTFFPGGGRRGEDEYYRVFFDDEGGKSHFVLGCAIANANVKMVSIYYKTSTDALPPLREEDIRYADLQGHIGLNINGQRRILLAVRQIVTKKIPARYNWGIPNCRVSDLEGNAPNPDSPKLLRDDRHQPIGFCCRPDVPCTTEPYVTLFGDGTNEFVFTPEQDIFVDANGALIIPRADYDDACRNWSDDIYGPHPSKEHVNLSHNDLGTSLAVRKAVRPLSSIVPELRWMMSEPDLSKVPVGKAVQHGPVTPLQNGVPKQAEDCQPCSPEITVASLQLHCLVAWEKYLRECQAAGQRISKISYSTPCGSRLPFATETMPLSHA